MGLRRERATRAGRARLKGDARASVFFVGSQRPSKSQNFQLYAVRVIWSPVPSSSDKVHARVGGAGGAFGWISPLGSTARDAYRRGRSVSIGVGVGESPQHALNPRGRSTFCVVLAHRRVIFLRRTITLYLRSSTEPPWGTRRSRRWETSSCSFLS